MCFTEDRALKQLKSGTTCTDLIYLQTLWMPVIWILVKGYWCQTQASCKLMLGTHLIVTQVIIGNEPFT